MQREVIYVGYEISAGQRTLGQARKEAICQTPRPQTVKGLRTFLGMTGWCWLWIYNYGLLVKPPYALTAAGQNHLEWNKETTQAFELLKKALMSALALGLPDVSQAVFPFLSRKAGDCSGDISTRSGSVSTSSCLSLQTTGCNCEGLAWMPASSCSCNIKYTGSPKIYLGPENDCLGVPHGIHSIGSKRRTLAFSTKIPEISGYTGRAG